MDFGCPPLIKKVAGYSLNFSAAGKYKSLPFSIKEERPKPSKSILNSVP